MKMFDYKTIKIKDNKRSIISETVIIEGTINSSELLEVAGLIKGPVNAKALIIKETGSIIGSIEAELLIINGFFHGKASATEITIGATGTIKGDIEFGNNFKTENGAEIEAQIKKTNNSELIDKFLFKKKDKKDTTTKTLSA